MSSHYSVVQYVPDPVTGERINVGVVVFGDGGVRTRFLRDWRRVQQFGEEDVHFLRDFASRASDWGRPDIPFPGLGTTIRLDEAGIREIAGRWMNSLQLTEPRSSLLSLDELLVDVAARFLRDPKRAHRGFRDHRAAAWLARRQIRAAIERVAGPGRANLVRTNAPVLGELDEHHFDVTVQNGELLLAAQGLSFEGPTSRDLEKQLGETAWAITDVRARSRDVPLGVVVLPPKTKAKIYDRALHVFDGLEAEVVVEGPQVEAWAERMARVVQRTT